MKLKILKDQRLISSTLQVTYLAGEEFEVISARPITPGSYAYNTNVPPVNPTFTLYDCGTVRFCFPDWEKGVSFKTDEV